MIEDRLPQFARIPAYRIKSIELAARYDLTPLAPRVRFIEAGAGAVTLMGHVVLPGYGRQTSYWANKAARAAITTLKG